MSEERKYAAVRKLHPNNDDFLLTLEQLDEGLNFAIKIDGDTVATVSGNFSIAHKAFDETYKLHKSLFMPDVYIDKYVDLIAKQNIDLYDAIEEEHQHIEDEKERIKRCLDVYNMLKETK